MTGKQIRKIPRKYKQNGEGKNKTMLKMATFYKKRCRIGIRYGVTTAMKTVMFSNIFQGRIGQNGNWVMSRQWQVRFRWVWYGWQFWKKAREAPFVTLFFSATSVSLHKKCAETHRGLNDPNLPKQQQTHLWAMVLFQIRGKRPLETQTVEFNNPETT